MTMLEVRDLRKSFPIKRNLLGRTVQSFDAVKGVSFDLPAGSTLGIVGETGAGKSTVGRMVLRLIEPDSGTVMFNGTDVRALDREALRKVRRHMQMIFQDPFSSLDPRMVIADTVGEPLTIFDGLKGEERTERVVDLLERVGLGRHQLERYPREFSGGQLQRVAIARALATGPDLIVCDEPVAALDVSIQAQVLNLLIDLQRERQLSYLFISHDLSLVRRFAHRVAVMRHGEIVEEGESDAVFEDPQHPYTKELASAMPVAKPRRKQRRAARLATGPNTTELEAPVEMAVSTEMSPPTDLTVPTEGEDLIT
ncbi:MAG: ATP-binding cassette domain-containing protein [Aeromicrobium sp.]